jgi:hypothetical protein
MGERGVRRGLPLTESLPVISEEARQLASTNWSEMGMSAFDPLRTFAELALTRGKQASQLQKTPPVLDAGARNYLVVDPAV